MPNYDGLDQLVDPAEPLWLERVREQTPVIRVEPIDALWDALNAAERLNALLFWLLIAMTIVATWGWCR